jgi:hypothetical protein
MQPDPQFPSFTGATPLAQHAKASDSLHSSWCACVVLLQHAVVACCGGKRVIVLVL